MSRAMTLFRASVSALALATLAQAAAAQGVPTGGGSGGGSGTVTSVTTTCPTSSNSPTGGNVTIHGGTPTTTQTGSSYTIQSTDCGSDISFTYSGTASIVVPSAVTMGANFVVNLSAASGTTLSLSSLGGNFLNDGTTALTVSPGQAASLVSNGTDWVVNVSASAPASTSAPAPVGNGSIGTSSELFYHLWPNTTVVTGNAITANQEQCAPFNITVAMHWDELIFDLTTVGSASVELALYDDAVDATTHRHQPQGVSGGGTLISAAITDTTAGVLTWSLGTAGTGISISPGVHWICINTGDTTLPKFTLAAASSSGVMTDLVGTLTAMNAVSTAQFSFLRYNSTYGTWATLTGLTMTEIAVQDVPFFAARVASAP